MTDSIPNSSDRPVRGNPPPHPSPSAPIIDLPANSCDSHCHIFGPAAVFPFAEGRSFTPVDVPKEQLMALHEHLGFRRAVIVQSSCHGTDNSVLLDALAVGAGRYRGVALIDGATSQHELDVLDAAGVCGFRLHFMPNLTALPTGEEVRSQVDRVADRGWHTEIHLAGTGVLDHYDLLTSIPGPVVVDHMARVDISNGLETAPVHALRDLLDRGNIWVKLSAIDRLSCAGPPYDDSVALARMLAAHAPERVLWGTDFPHPNIIGAAPDDGLLVSRLADIVPDSNDLEHLLVTNPTTFFGFDEDGEPAGDEA